MTTLPMDPAALAGKTRADLLELCREAGFKATAWKRDRMAAALTGAEAPPQPKAAALAGQLERRPATESGEAARRRSAEEQAKHTGRCQSTTCRAECSEYAFGGQDAFHWDLCVCGHTQWAHERPAAQTA